MKGSLLESEEGIERVGRRLQVSSRWRRHFEGTGGGRVPEERGSGGVPFPFIPSLEPTFSMWGRPRHDGMSRCSNSPVP